MSSKILKKYTTIPEHLYVNRSADSQLKAIIEEMQRPGYVLVARQMGKTNLLFHAKRTLENEKRLFVYVDLSNLYENERECYRNIIDSILEPNLDLFSSLSTSISAIREQNLPPHKEYSRCLRLVLDDFKGDVVVILDEIDALKSVPYSDNIFAQIRSNYFSRTNFPEFERLTYVLSGVIEPTELIKDKNKSPFNIGDKIYLDDFTSEEHEIFIHKSQLKIDKIISKEIFNWTNGNPRLTFDICSAVEDQILDGKEITKQNIYSIIKQKYLTSFDIAPIDHIRELVKTNKEVRNAIKSIHSKKYYELNDDIKRKLYLYGIINSKFDEATAIKNKIIEQSLTEDWIKSIERRTASSFAYGLAQFDNREFKDTITTLKDYLLTGNPSDNEIEVSNYYIGFSHYHLKEFKTAIEYFSKDYKTEPYKSNSKSFLGICKLAIGEKQEGMSILEELLGEEVDKFAYHNSLLNLAINLDDNEHEKSMSLLERLYASTLEEDNNIKPDELKQLRALSLYYQADLLQRQHRKEEAAQRVSLALGHASLSDSIFLTYFLSTLREGKDESLKSEIVKTVIENNIVLDEYNSTPISFAEKHLVSILEELFEQSNLSLFERLLEYSSAKIYNGNVTKFELTHAISALSSEKKTAILDYLFNNRSLIADQVLIKIYKDLLNLNVSNRESYLKYFDLYLPLFKSSDTVAGEDIYLFALGIKFKSDLLKFDDALELCGIIERRILFTEDEDLVFESVIIYYWYSNLYLSKRNTEKANAFADKTLSIIEQNRHKKASMIDEKGLKQIADQMLGVKRSSRTNIPFVRTKKYGANEWVKVQYSDGSILQKKYKKVEADIQAERCVIIDE